MAKNISGESRLTTAPAAAIVLFNDDQLDRLKAQLAEYDTRYPDEVAWKLADVASLQGEEAVEASRRFAGRTALQAIIETATPARQDAPHKPAIVLMSDAALLFEKATGQKVLDTVWAPFSHDIETDWYAPDLDRAERVAGRWGRLFAGAYGNAQAIILDRPMMLRDTGLLPGSVPAQATVPAEETTPGQSDASEA